MVASSTLSKAINKFIDIEQSKKTARTFVGVNTCEKKKKKEAIDEAGLQIFASNLLVSLPMRPYLALTNKHST